MGGGGPPAAIIGLIAGLIAHQRAYFPRAPMGTNGFDMTVFLGSLVALVLAYRVRGQERWLWLACSLVSLGGLLATESRTALAGWVAGAAFLAWQAFRDRYRRLGWALASGLVVVALVDAVMLPVGARVRQAFRDHTSVDRPLIWRISVAMIEAYPFLGIGPGTFQTVFDRLNAAGVEREWSAHNLWLNFAAETGLLGLLSMLWVVLIGVREWIRAGRRPPPSGDTTRPIVTAMLIGVFLDQSGDNTLLSVSSISGFWLLLAMMVVPVPSAAGKRAAADDNEAREGGPPHCDS